MFRVSVLSGQVYGNVDWVTADGREFGMYLRTSPQTTTRCVMRGPEVERMLANGMVQKGMTVTAYGELTGRCLTRHGNGEQMPEIIVEADKVIAEDASREGRLRGAIYANMKGVAMHWDASKLQLKTFFNYTQPDRPERLTCSLHMKSWLDGMSDDGKARFLANMRSGREFVASALVEASFYKSSAGLIVPTLLLLPTDFKLQM